MCPLWLITQIAFLQILVHYPRIYEEFLKSIYFLSQKCDPEYVAWENKSCSLFPVQINPIKMGSEWIWKHHTSTTDFLIRNVLHWKLIIAVYDFIRKVKTFLAPYIPASSKIHISFLGVHRDRQSFISTGNHLSGCFLLNCH